MNVAVQTLTRSTPDQAHPAANARPAAAPEQPLPTLAYYRDWWRPRALGAHLAPVAVTATPPPAALAYFRDWWRTYEPTPASGAVAAPAAGRAPAAYRDWWKD